jgi:hypothetical protein
MLIVALVLATIGLAALVTAVVTSNELIAWVCIGASGLGILLLIVDAIRDRAHRRAEFPAAVPATMVETTEVIEPVQTTEVIEPVETTEVIEPVQTTASLDDETPRAAENFSEEVLAEEDLTEEFLVDEESAEPAEIPEEVSAGAAEELAEDIVEEDHPDELVHDDPDFDTPSDDEADYPEPAEEAAIHTVDESYLAQDVDDEIVAEAAPESAPVGDESAIEVRYIPGPDSSAHTVVYTYSESAETEYVDTEDSTVGEEPRAQ